MVFAAIAGCIGQFGESNGEFSDSPAIVPVISPEKQEHTYGEMVEMMNALNAEYPGLVEILSIGKSVQDRDIWCIRITNENIAEGKMECLIDGCMHGTETAGEETCIVLMNYLLWNYNTNATVRNIVDSNIINIIPIANPDGREAATRGNANGIDINRNYDIDWGNPIGMSIPDPLGTGHQFENCGSAPFSEPESRAMRDFMEVCDSNGNFAFYFNMHTNAFCLISPWDAANPPFDVPQKDRDLFHAVFKWTMENTIYSATGSGMYPSDWSEFSVGAYYSSGEAKDWCYMRHRVPSFLLELYNASMTPSDMNYWVQASLPIIVYLLEVSPELYAWEDPSTDIKIDLGIEGDSV